MLFINQNTLLQTTTKLGLSILTVFYTSLLGSRVFHFYFYFLLLVFGIVLQRLFYCFLFLVDGISYTSIYFLVISTTIRFKPIISYILLKSLTTNSLLVALQLDRCYLIHHFFPLKKIGEKLMLIKRGIFINQKFLDASQLLIKLCNLRSTDHRLCQNFVSFYCQS